MFRFKLDVFMRKEYEKEEKGKTRKIATAMKGCLSIAVIIPCVPMAKRGARLGEGSEFCDSSGCNFCLIHV